MKIGIFYGSSTGNTEAAAQAIAKTLADAGEVRIAGIAETAFAVFANYDALILGASTWGIGDIQDDWTGKDDFSGVDLSGKKVAVFGTGDQESFGDTFVDAVGILAKAAERAGATLIGAWPTNGYDYSSSAAEREGKFLGLALDDDNQDDQTDERIAAWCAQLKEELAG
ncbi:MAG: flavodoxin [Verrucomicrobiota bacterium]